MTSDEAEALTPILRHIARRVGGSFPERLMDLNDFMQEGIVGILELQAEGKGIGDEHRDLQHKAAEYAMIDAMRRFSDPRPGKKRKQEILVANIEQAADSTTIEVNAEETCHHKLDMSALASLLPYREQAVLRARLRGEALKSIGDRLRLSEGRICQIEKEVVVAMREAA